MVGVSVAKCENATFSLSLRCCMVVVTVVAMLFLVVVLAHIFYTFLFRVYKTSAERSGLALHFSLPVASCVAIHSSFNVQCAIEMKIVETIERERALKEIDK